jgi:hypothetical protein
MNFVLITLAILGVCIQSAIAQTSVEEAMDAIVSRLYNDLSLEELVALDDARVHTLITPEERAVLATKHWSFDVDQPVVISLMRNVEQKVTPFWIEEAGFTKTDMTVTNMEGWKYEVWQKAFPAGRVELGINGFDNFRPHYFVSVAPQTPGATVTLSKFHPENQTVLEMKPGALTYHDWTELVLTEVPDALVGQQLLTTIRGRGKEAALVGAFRETPFPSSTAPDPVYLTWSGDPATTQTIQWRTNTTVADGLVRYRVKGSQGEYAEANASHKAMDDLMLANDRVCHWHTAQLDGLAPGTTYEYIVGSASSGQFTAPSEFATAPAVSKPFTFLYCSDTHSNEKWGDVMSSTFAKYPEAAFVTISGDLVGTGLEREDWDMFLAYGQPVFRTRPVMPAIGNHDAQLGLGAGMYLDIFGLPENGPAGISPEAAYTFTYGNTDFFVLDVMSESAPQATWLREQLAQSDAKWKIAVFHFPIFNHEEPYPVLQAEWGTLFDEFHVDLVLTGHIHTHMRTYPMRAGKVVNSSKDGTVHVISISIPNRGFDAPKPEFAEAWVRSDYFCNVISIDDTRLEFRAVNPNGEVKDQFVLEK